MQFWLAFKALGAGTKAAVIGGILAILLAILATTAIMSYNKGVAVSKVRIAQYEAKSAKLSQKQTEAQAGVDVRTVTEYKDRVQYVDRVVYRTRDVVKYAVPEQFKLSKGWIYVYNQSAAGLEPESGRAADATSSATSDRGALDVAVENNGICLTNAARLEALQKWARDSEKAREEANK